MELTLSPLIAWISALALFLSFATNLWNIIGSTARNNGRRIDEVSDRQERMEQRVASVEQTLRGMPNKDDTHLVQIALTEMRGDLRAMQASMNGHMDIMKRLESIVTRHEEHLLNGAKR